MKIAGFTGTREGMSKKQQMDLAKRLRYHGIEEFHHGDCRGADEQAHLVAQILELKIVGHPPLIDNHRAFCIFDVEMLPLPYLERNRKIVDSVEILFVAPLTMHEELRSGTWATYRYAKKIGRRCEVLERR